MKSLSASLGPLAAEPETTGWVLVNVNTESEGGRDNDQKRAPAL